MQRAKPCSAQWDLQDGATCTPGPPGRAPKIIVGCASSRTTPSANLLKPRPVSFRRVDELQLVWLFETGFDFLRPTGRRELADGTSHRAAGLVPVWFGTCPPTSRKRLQVQFYWTEGRSFPPLRAAEPVGGDAGVQGRLPQLDGSFDLAYTESAGTIRQIREAGPQPDPQRGPSIRLMDRFPGTGATNKPRLYIPRPTAGRAGRQRDPARPYAFTPHLTLQAYGQALHCRDLFTASAVRAAVEPGRRSPSGLDELGPAKRRRQGVRGPPATDEQQVGAEPSTDPPLGVAHRLDLLPGLRAPRAATT